MEKIIHFIWVGCPLPEWAQYNMDQFKRLNPDYEIMLHDESALDPVFEERYHADKDLCLKSDLLRLSVLKKHGGWYFDCDYLPLRPVDSIIEAYGIEKPVFITKQHWHKNRTLIYANGLLALPKAPHIFWDRIIEEMMKINMHKPGRVKYGPRLFTSLVERYADMFDVGDWQFFYPLGAEQAQSAFREYRKGDLSSNQMSKIQSETMGQLPFVMHLWANGGQELTKYDPSWKFQYQTMSDREVIILGSGMTAPQINDIETSDKIIIAINNAWKATDKWSYLLHPNDFFNLPESIRDDQEIVGGIQMNREAIERNGGLKYVGKTMFLNAAWWAMEVLRPCKIGFLGCDLHYPKEGNNTFYGIGTPDPLRLGEQLFVYIKRMEKKAEQFNVQLVNFSDGEAILPIKREAYENPFQICAFYTKETPYESEKEVLLNSLKHWHFEPYIKGIKNQGSWVKNCAMKSTFIRNCMDKFPNKAILYLDVDAKIKQFPKIFNTMTEDIGVHYYLKELLSGTLYLKNNDRTRRLVDYWIEEQACQPEVWDQKILQQVIDEHQDDLELDIRNLPQTYTQIFDTMQGDDPVIEHYMANRRFKTLIDSGAKHTVLETICEDDKILDIPKSIDKVRIRIGVDGLFWIHQKNKKAEAWLDKHLERIGTECRWRKKIVSLNTFSSLKGTYQDQDCYIIGKGPSLDKLKRTDFVSNGPVIAINDSIRIIEGFKLANPIFAIQLDDRLKDSCLPRMGQMLAMMTCAEWYADHLNTYFFDWKDVNLKPGMPSLVPAVAVGKHMGCSSFKMMCFDAAVTKELGYAECIPEKPIGNQKMWFDHRRQVEESFPADQIEWILPH